MNDPKWFLKNIIGHMKEATEKLEEATKETWVFDPVNEDMPVDALVEIVIDHGMWMIESLIHEAIDEMFCGLPQSMSDDEAMAAVRQKVKEALSEASLSLYGWRVYRGGHLLTSIMRSLRRYLDLYGKHDDNLDLQKIFFENVVPVLSFRCEDELKGDGLWRWRESVKNVV